MAFKMRTTRPEKGNKYYITKSNGGYSDAVKGSPTNKDCNVLSNCVGYAYGRFNEIGGYGYCKYLRPVNAENFMSYIGNLKTGMTPKVGACMVWRKGPTLNSSDGAGHVAIVEKVISNTEVITSESGWGDSRVFWNQTRKKGSDGRWGQNSNFTFLGFIYNPAIKDEPTITTTTTTKKEATSMAVKIGHARIDERGKIVGGAAGDQTGREVCTSNWYNGNWTTVFRPKDSKVAEKIAKCCEQACANNNIGYDQYQRTTLFDAAQKVGFNLSKITSKVETDCSALVAVCCNAAGLKVSKNMYTGNETSILTNTGAFTIYKDSKYRTSSDYLKRGDILLKDGHTAMVLSNGSKAGSSTTTTTTTKAPTVTDIADFSAEVTNVSTSLNVRKGPGTNYAVVAELKNKTAITVTGQSGSWYKIKYSGGTGFVHKDYVSKKKTTTTTTKKVTPTTTKKTTTTVKKAVGYKVKITAKSGLNVRKGPGKSYFIDDVLALGTIVTIVETKGKWGRIANKGWICLDYTKRV